MPVYAWGGAGGGEGTGKSGTAGFWIWTPHLGLILHPVPNNYDLKNEKLRVSTEMPSTIQMITLSGALERNLLRLNLLQAAESSHWAQSSPRPSPVDVPANSSEKS